MACPLRPTIFTRNRVPDKRDLASETGFTKRYISRTLRGAFLAPDITEMILDGLQAPDLTVRKLMDGFPVDWPSQRLALKITPR